MKRQREITQQLITLRTTKPGMVCWHQNRQETRDKRQETRDKRQETRDNSV